MMDIHLNCYRMRHIVPFVYETSGKTYEELHTAMEYDADWELVGVNESEHDIYHYMNSSFIQKQNKSNIGSAWNYLRKDSKNRILHLVWRRETEDCEVIIKDAGLFLFRSGIGLFWYEIELKNYNITMDELITFQNKFKEYAHSGNANLFYEIVSENVTHNIDNNTLKCREDISSNSLDNYKRFIKNNKEVFVEKTSIPHRLDNYEYCSCKGLAGRDNNLKLMFCGCRKFIMGNWIAVILSKLPCTLKFYPERKNCYPTVADVLPDLYPAMIPDKAIMFNYVVADDGENQGAGDGSANNGQNSLENMIDDSLSKMAFYLTNGYKYTYSPTSDIEEHMYRPFHNACWYVTKSGCGYYIKCEEKNKVFFTNEMKNKVITDYFILYIHLLHQSYSLLRYAGVIEQTLSADSTDYLKNSADYTKILESVSTQVNAFLVKSVYASVSHIHHQNDFYGYAEKMLGIKEDIESVTIGLDSLEELHKMKIQERKEKEEKRRENKLNLGMGALSLLAIFSAFVDGVEFVDAVKELILIKDFFKLLPYGIVVLMILIVSIYAIVRFGCSLREALKDKDE